MIRLKRILASAAACAGAALLAGMPVMAAPAVMADGQVFDAAYYAEQNPDVAEQIGTDETLLYQHYTLYGQQEGRSPYDPSLDKDTALSQALEEMQRRGIAYVAANGNVLYTGLVTDPVFFGKVQNIITSVTTLDMTPDQKLRACYQYVLDHTTYKRTYDTPSGDWTRQYASDIYDTGKGNCYRYAAAFAYLAKGLGYQVHVCTGQISAARGGLTPHGWVEIWDGTQWLICDPDMQDSKGGNYYLRTFANYPVKPLVQEQVWELSF